MYIHIRAGVDVYTSTYTYIHTTRGESRAADTRELERERIALCVSWSLNRVTSGHPPPLSLSLAFSSHWRSLTHDWLCRGQRSGRLRTTRTSAPRYSGSQESPRASLRLRHLHRVDARRADVFFFYFRIARIEAALLCREQSVAVLWRGLTFILWWDRQLAFFCWTRFHVYTE